MPGKISGKTNIIWTVSIVISLMALIVGFFVAAVQPFYAVETAPKVPAVQDAGSIIEQSGTLIIDDGSAAMLNALEETGDAGQIYLDSLVFMCDSVNAGIYDKLSSYQVLCGADGTVPVSALSTSDIRYHDGSEITAPGAMMVMKPKILVLCIGSDGLTEISNESFTASYTKLINDVRSASPQTQIICCSIPPVAAGYKGEDKLTNDKVSKANGWLQQVCVDTGAYYADTASAVTGVGAVLDPAYAQSDGKTLNADGAAKIIVYLQTHALILN